MVLRNTGRTQRVDKELQRLLAAQAFLGNGLTRELFQRRLRQGVIDGWRIHPQTVHGIGKDRFGQFFDVGFDLMHGVYLLTMLESGGGHLAVLRSFTHPLGY